MRSIAFILSFSLIINIAWAQSNITDLQLMHTTPVCSHPGKTAAWCTHDDMVESSKASGMIDKINAQIDLAKDSSKANIYVAYFSFSNKPVFRKLCDKAKEGINIEFFLDNSYRGTDLTNELVACATRNNVHFHFMGKTDVSDPNNIVWRLHHNKFLIVDSGEDDTIKINFSSGNLSSFGTSLHFDHWVTATVQRNSNMYATHLCVVSSMKKALDIDNDGQDDSIDDPEVYRQSLNSCLKKSNALSIDEALRTEKIAPLFSPNPNNTIARTLIQEIENVPAGQKIAGAIQHFTHSSIASALVDACQRGVEVKMIMDDDVLSGESEVPGVGEFFNSYLDNTCIQIQFMQTNASEHQMMHNKFLMLGDKYVFAGAGHFTYSAMTKNYENFYLMEDRTIHQQYQELFDFMWNMSLTKEQATPNGDSDTPTTPEDPSST
ncbi:MAG: hypothetical protein H6623_06560 [Bdellovibrionaceae bacterium]|nr:hypothetical protein [Pseudobdellovibrionaceae bacterium]